MYTYLCMLHMYFICMYKVYIIIFEISDNYSFFDIRTYKVHGSGGLNRPVGSGTIRCALLK